jgi:hypothetical protein
LPLTQYGLAIEILRVRPHGRGEQALAANQSSWSPKTTGQIPTLTLARAAQSKLGITGAWDLCTDETSSMRSRLKPFLAKTGLISQSHGQRIKNNIVRQTIDLCMSELADSASCALRRLSAVIIIRGPEHV